MIRIRLLSAGATSEIALVADRMRLTLQEVLGAERGAEMYSESWLRDRVRQHLDRADAAVFVAESPAGITGHTIVRVEDKPVRHGLFSTTYVDPSWRRQGVAAALVDRGETWMREQRVSEAATFTARDNSKLIALYTRRGYACESVDAEMVRLCMSLSRA